MKLVFFRYILTQKEASLLYQFLLAQKNDPKQGDWYSEIKRILNEFELDLSDEAIMMTKETIFKNLVKKKALSAGLKYLTEKQKKGEKGRDILYESFQLQDYLCPYSNLDLEEQRLLFSLTSRMNPLKKISLKK